jgi:hypothetical protein
VLTAAVLVAGRAVAAPADVTGLTAAVYNPGSFDDTAINLSWSAVPGAIGYNIYRVESAPVQAQATVTALYGDAWANLARINDANYYLSGSIGTTPNVQTLGRNVGVLLTFPDNLHIGGVSFLPGPHDWAANYTTSQYALTVGATSITGGNVSVTWGRSGVCSQEFRPIFTNTVQVELGGTFYDPATGIAEIDVWEYKLVASGVGGTSFVDAGRTPGQSYTYYVTAVDGSGESAGLSNRASLLAGDRDDTNSGNTMVDPATGPTAGTRTIFTRGSFSAMPARGQVPNPGTNLQDPDGAAQTTITWAASSTESTPAQDVKKYLVFRGSGAATPQEIQTQALPVNGGNGVLSKSDIAGTANRAINGIDGNLNTVARLGSSNYGESDYTIDFGDGRYFAMVGMRIYQGGPGYNAQHCFRRAYFETSGGYVTPTVTFSIDNAYTTTWFNSADSNGYATFGFDVETNPAQWLVGESLTLHLEAGENAPAHREFIIYGIPLTLLGEVYADGSGTYSFIDPLGGVYGTSYDYFIVAEDFAGNQSVSLYGTALVPEPGTLLLAGGLAGILCLGRRRR